MDLFIDQVYSSSLAPRNISYELAQNGFQDALKRAEAIGTPDIAIAAEEGIGTVYYEQGKYQASLEWLDKAWSKAQTISEKIRMTELLWRKGQVFYAQGEYAQSSELANRAAELSRTA